MIKLLFIFHIVTATMYTLAPKENGPYGNKLASGFRANPKFPQKNRVIAVSRDLLTEFPFHSEVIITGTGKFDGVWKVEDIMNERYTDRIDFLINYKTKQQVFHNIKIDHYEYASGIKISHSRSFATDSLRTTQNRKHFKKHNHRNKKTRLHTTRQSIQHKRRIRKVSNDFRNTSRR